MYVYNTSNYDIVEPPDKGHFGDNVNSADLFFIERFYLCGGSKRTVGITVEPLITNSPKSENLSITYCFRWSRQIAMFCNNL